MFVQEKKKVHKEQISKEVPYKKNLRSHAQLSDTSNYVRDLHECGNEIFSPFVCRNFVVNGRGREGDSTYITAGLVSTPNYGAHGHRQDSCDDHVLKETAATSTADTTLLLLQLHYSSEEEVLDYLLKYFSLVLYVLQITKVNKALVDSKYCSYSHKAAA
jgi:hypothetical protein